MKLLTLAAGLLLALTLACGGVPKTAWELEDAVSKSLGRHSDPDAQVIADPTGEYRWWPSTGR